MSDGMHGLADAQAIVSLKSCRSSALSMASALVPMRRTPCFSRKPSCDKLHRDGQAGLAAQSGEQAVRLFLVDDALDRLRCQRLKIDFVRP